MRFQKGHTGYRTKESYIKSGKKISKTKMGHFVSEKTKKKISKNRKGKSAQNAEKNPLWKGDKVGYHGLHSWVNRNFIRPDKCEICSKPDNAQRRQQWAKKDHSNNSRNREDWIYLCAKCHVNYDISHQNKSINFDRNKNNTMTQRQCNVCKKVLTLNKINFSPSTYHTLGFGYTCKKCRNEISILKNKI